MPLGLVIRKLGYGMLVLWGVLSVVFLLFNVLPGDPARMLLGQRDDAEMLKQVRAKYGFDQPLGMQYINYLNDLSPVSVHSTEASDYSHWNERYEGAKLFETKSFVLALKKPFLRFSFQNQGLGVSTVLAQALPNTLILALSAMTLAMFFGLLLGMVSAWAPNGWLDRCIALFSSAGMALPSFFSAIIIAWLFGFVWAELTGLSMTGSLYAIDDYGSGEYIQWKNLILPAVTLGIRPIAVIAQLTRNSILEVWGMDYIRTARAKGLNKRQVMLKHALPNALNPVITAASGWLASMMAGAVFVEYIFGWNGLGKLVVDALNTMDLPVVMGAVLTIAVIFVLINLIVDLLYLWLDPRLRLA